MIQQGQSAAAIDYVFSTNPQMEKMADEKDQLKAKIGGIEKIVGPYISHKKLAETKVVGMFVYQHYFVAYDRQPMSLKLKFYKAHNAWRLLGIQFDDDLCDTIAKQTDANLYNELVTRDRAAERNETKVPQISLEPHASPTLGKSVKGSAGAGATF